MSTPISNLKVILADRHDLLRMGIKALCENEPDITVLGEADNFEDTIQLVNTYQPHILITDLALCDGEIIERLPEINLVSSKTRILILTADDNRENHLLSLRMGAMGIVNKNHNPRILLQAIRAIHIGQAWIDRTMTTKIWESLILPVDTPEINSTPHSQLTSRENDIINLALKGLPARKIGKELHISEKTVRNQLSIIGYPFKPGQFSKSAGCE